MMHSIALSLVAATTLLGCSSSASPSSSGTTGWPDDGPDDSPEEPVDVEPCNGLDDDGDGSVDEGCDCAEGKTQLCYAGTPDLAGVGACVLGTQTCVPDVEFGRWGTCEGWAPPSPEVCDNGVDDDCTGAQEGCETLTLTIDIDGDCLTVSCPPTNPYPVACDVQFVGNDSRGCVAFAPGSHAVYFQEGNRCNAGHLSGTLTCSTEPGAPLDAANCPIDKEDARYVANEDDCPQEDDPIQN